MFVVEIRLPTNDIRDIRFQFLSVEDNIQVEIIVIRFVHLETGNPSEHDGNVIIKNDYIILFL